MPLYEYACRKCDHAFEMLVRDGETIECPACHSPDLARQWSVPARPQTTTAALPPCGPGCCRMPRKT